MGSYSVIVIWFENGIRRAFLIPLFTEQCPVFLRIDVVNNLIRYVGGIWLSIHELTRPQIDSPCLSSSNDRHVRRLSALLFPNLDLPTGFSKGSREREIKWHQHAFAIDSSTHPNNRCFLQEPGYVHFVVKSIRDIIPYISSDLFTDTPT